MNSDVKRSNLMMFGAEESPGVKALIFRVNKSPNPLPEQNMSREETSL